MTTEHHNNKENKQQQASTSVEVIGLKQKLTENLLLLHPSLKYYQASNCVEKYINATLSELVSQDCIFPTNQIFDGLQFSLNRATNEAGKITIDGQQHWIFPLMQSDSSTKLLQVMFKGNIGKNSKVVYNLRYKGQIMKELENLTIELNPTLLKEYQDGANNDIDVDPTALLSFIIKSKETLQITSNSREYKDKIIKNIRIASTLMDQIKEKDGEYYLSEYWEQIDSGRWYGHGISLQRIAKDVRHAALGKCHKYDFKACSYATMTGLALSIDPTIKHCALTDYIKSRSIIRKKIADEIGIQVDGKYGMKQIFTSMGFGASTKDNPYSSIRDMIGADKFNLLMQNSLFIGIKEQLDVVRKVILKEFNEDEFEFAGRNYSIIDPNTGHKRSKNQKLAWIYQSMEAKALEIFKEECKVDVILTTHDCIYTKQKVPSSNLADMNYIIQKVFPLLTFEHEMIVPIHTAEDHNKENKEINKEIFKHQRLVADSEKVAESYVPVNSTVGGGSKKKPKQIETPWGWVDADMIQEEQTTDNKYFKDDYYGQY